MVTLILGEGLVEPILNVDFHVPSKLGLEPVRRNTVVCQAARDQLQRIHVNAFQPDEQYYSMEYMLQAAREGSHEFRIIGYSGQLVGYLCYEKGIAGKEDAALWYLAIEKERRGEGLGGKAIKAFLDELRESPDPVRYCLLECHRPSHGAPPSDFDRRRVKFYTRQGAYWLKDLEYGVPSHTDHSRTIPYEVLVFPIAGPIEREKVKQAVLALAGAGMKPDDDRYRRLEASLDSMVIQPPPGAEGKCSSED